MLLQRSDASLDGRKSVTKEMRRCLAACQNAAKQVTSNRWDETASLFEQGAVSVSKASRSLD